MEDYFPGVDLPPHLSPFVKEEEGDYIPPERQAMLEDMEQEQTKEDKGWWTIIKKSYPVSFSSLTWRLVWVLVQQGRDCMFTLLTCCKFIFRS